MTEVGRATVEARPDVAIVIVGSDSEPQALRWIDMTVKEAACPVIAILDVQDRDVHQRGREARHLRVHRGRQRPG